MKQNVNVVWYSIFTVAMVLGCSLISIRVMTVISYISILRVIKFFKTDMTFFGCFVLSLHYIGKLYYWLLRNSCVQLVHLIFSVLYKRLYAVFTKVNFQQIKNISISKYVVYTPSRQYLCTYLFCV